MKLIITEKPSVEKLGVTFRADGFYEGNGHLISWCIGHLVGLAEAVAYNERFKKWIYDDLPILPEPFRYEVVPKRRRSSMSLKSSWSTPTWLSL